MVFWLFSSYFFFCLFFITFWFCGFDYFLIVYVVHGRFIIIIIILIF
jgi:hypothetical protein